MKDTANQRQPRSEGIGKINILTSFSSNSLGLYRGSPLAKLNQNAEGTGSCLCGLHSSASQRIKQEEEGREKAWRGIENIQHAALMQSIIISAKVKPKSFLIIHSCSPPMYSPNYIPYLKPNSYFLKGSKSLRPQPHVGSLSHSLPLFLSHRPSFSS